MVIKKSHDETYLIKLDRREIHDLKSLVVWSYDNNCPTRTFDRSKIKRRLEAIETTPPTDAWT